MRYKGKDWTEEQDQILREQVQTGKSYAQIALLIPGRSRDGVARRAGNLGLKNSYVYRLYHNNKFFWTVPNEVNSYFAGLLAADGTIVIRKESGINQVRLDISSKDEYLLEEWKRLIEFDGPIRRYKSKTPYGELKDYSEVSINCIQCVRDLDKNFGVIPKKTFRMIPPVLDFDLRLCYLTGYIDGDGTIAIGNQNKGLVISICSSNLTILSWIKEIILSLNLKSGRSNWDNNPSIITHKDCAMHHYTITGHRAVHLFLILKSLPIPHLPRKWENPKVLQLIQNHIDKHGDPREKTLNDFPLPTSSFSV